MWHGFEFLLQLLLTIELIWVIYLEWRMERKGRDEKEQIDTWEEKLKGL